MDPKIESLKRIRERVILLPLIRQVIDPIAPVLRKVKPQADTTQIGSWGILYIVCGSLAGQSSDWKATITECVPMAREAAKRWIPSHQSDTRLALKLSDKILTWFRNSFAEQIARKQLNRLENVRGFVLPTNARRQFTDYFRLVTVLNGLRTLKSDQLDTIRQWVGYRDHGWPILLFASGIILQHKREFPWPSIAAGYFMTNESVHKTMTTLLTGYDHRVANNHIQD